MITGKQIFVEPQKCRYFNNEMRVLGEMIFSLQKQDQVFKIWSPPFCGGPRPIAPMAPIDGKALITSMTIT